MHALSSNAASHHVNVGCINVVTVHSGRARGGGIEIGIPMSSSYTSGEGITNTVAARLAGPDCALAGFRRVGVA
jgi:hypothetical protein